MTDKVKVELLKIIYEDFGGEIVMRKGTEILADVVYGAYEDRRDDYALEHDYRMVKSEFDTYGVDSALELLKYYDVHYKNLRKRNEEGE